MKKIIFAIYVVGLLSNLLANDFTQGIENLKKGEYSIAFDTFLKGCNKGDGKSCSKIGVMYSNQLGIKRNFNQAFTFMEKACSLNDMGGCVSLGMMLRDGMGIEKKDEKLALSTFSKTCKKGIELACFFEKDVYRQIYGVTMPTNEKNLIQIPKKKEKISILLKCEKYGDAKSCLSIAYKYHKNDDLVHHMQKALKYYKIACNLGNTKGCQITVGLIEIDLGRDAAIEYANNLCMKKNTMGCKLINYYRNLKEKQNILKVNTEKCKDKNASSCTKIAKIFYQAGGDNNLTYAIKLYEKGCSYGNSKACIELGNFYKRGIHTNTKEIIESNRKKSCEYYNDACKLGNENSCKKAKYCFKFLKKFQKKYKNELPKMIEKCKVGIRESCNDVAHLYIRNHEYSTALKYYIEGCNENDSYSCSNASSLYIGVLYRKGKYAIIQDKSKGLEYLNKACSLGDENACIGVNYYNKK